MNNFEFKNLTPFKWFVLENFPFIEADFDALTNWQLFCKIGKEINKIIDSQNTVGTQTEELTTSFNNLYNYVTNYFNNLDVQTEINNKLDEMAQDGTLAGLINQEMQQLLTDINNRVSLLDNKKYIFIGDSLGNGASFQNGAIIHINGWCKVFADILELNESDYIIKTQDGAGFINGEYINLINSAINDITDKSSITDIIVNVGANEITNFNSETLNNNLINFINICKSNFINAKITFGFMAYNKQNNDIIANYRYLWQTEIKSIINNVALTHNITFFDNLNSIWHWDDFVSEDGIHLNQNGYNILGALFVNDYKGGKSNGIENSTPQFLKSFTNPSNITRNNLNESIKTIINSTTATIILSENLIEGSIPLNNNLYLLGSNVKMVGINPTPKLMNIKIPVTYIANDGSNLIYTNGELIFNVDGNLYLKPFGNNIPENIVALIITTSSLSIPIELC